MEYSNRKTEGRTIAKVAESGVIAVDRLKARV
jgi:hypothetical protein